MAEVTRYLQELQQKEEHSLEDLDFDYREEASGGAGAGSASSASSILPAGLTYSGAFDILPQSPATTTSTTTTPYRSNLTSPRSFAPPPPPPMARLASMDYAAATQPSLQMSHGMLESSGSMLYAGRLGSVGYNLKQPQQQIFSPWCRNPEIMTGMVANPTIHPGHATASL
jgi:hypothetical protein